MVKKVLVFFLADNRAVFTGIRVDGWIALWNGAQVICRT